jgi:hypothetical protein
LNLKWIKFETDSSLKTSDYEDYTEKEKVINEVLKEMEEYGELEDTD